MKADSCYDERPFCSRGSNVGPATAGCDVNPIARWCRGLDPVIYRDDVPRPAAASLKEYERLIPHDLRRTAVRNLLRVAVPTPVALKLTGHKTESAFTRYDITSPNDLLVAVEHLDAGGARCIVA